MSLPSILSCFSPSEETFSRSSESVVDAVHRSTLDQLLTERGFRPPEQQHQLADRFLNGLDRSLRTIGLEFEHYARFERVRDFVSGELDER
jgi:hypothetical protein